MKKLTLLYIVLTIVAVGAIYFFFFRTNQPEPIKLSDEPSMVVPGNNPNYTEYQQEQERLRKDLGQ